MLDLQRIPLAVFPLPDEMNQMLFSVMMEAQKGFGVARSRIRGRERGKVAMEKRGRISFEISFPSRIRHNY